MPATRPTLLAALALGLLTVASACDRGTLDPGSDTTGSGGSAGANDGGAAVCGPVCDIFCGYGNVLDANGCPTCACKPDPGCPTIQLNCGRIYCAYGFAPDANGCQTCACAPPPVCDGVATGICTHSLPPICECDPGQPCASNECPPPPPGPTTFCPDGSVAPIECVRNDDRRTCGWAVRPCPPVTE